MGHDGQNGFKRALTRRDEEGRDARTPDDKKDHCGDAVARMEQTSTMDDAMSRWLGHCDGVPPLARSSSPPPRAGVSLRCLLSQSYESKFGDLPVSLNRHDETGGKPGRRGRRDGTRITRLLV